MLHRDVNSTAAVKFTFTPMHGVGQKFAALAFEAFNLAPFISVKEQVRLTSVVVVIIVHAIVITIVVADVNNLCLLSDGTWSWLPNC